MKIDAESRAEKVAKDKKDKEIEIKNLNIKLTSLKAERTRNEEAVLNYKEHKEFLDKLAPKEKEEEK